MSEYEYVNPLSTLSPVATGYNFNDKIFDREAHDAFTVPNYKFQSFDVINGWLDVPTNLNENVKKEKVKNRIMTDIHEVSSDMNLDYFGEVTDKEVSNAIPGLCKTIYVNEARMALVSWVFTVSNSTKQVTEHNAGEETPVPTTFDDDCAGFYLFIGTPNVKVKHIGKVTHGYRGPDQYAPKFDSRFGKAVLSGHTMLNLGAGWNTLGVAMVATTNEDKTHIRVHARTLKIITFT